MPITVTITPAQAVQAGACWRVLFAEDEPGEWLASGTVVSAHDPRRYRVEFSSIPGWRTPAPIWVRNVTDFTNRNQGSYQQLTAYELGQISPQSALHGQTLEFMLPRGEALTVNCEPTPVGEVSYDAATGAFRYLPADDDKLPFSVTLQRFASDSTERAELLSVLEQFSWHRQKAARALGMDRTTLWRKMKKYGLLK